MLRNCIFNSAKMLIYIHYKRLRRIFEAAAISLCNSLKYSSFSVDSTLLPRYVNLSTSLRGVPSRVAFYSISPYVEQIHFKWLRYIPPLDNIFHIYYNFMLFFLPFFCFFLLLIRSKALVKSTNINVACRFFARTP